MTHAARWTLSRLASFGAGAPCDAAAVGELAAAGLAVATPAGWAISARGFAALPPHEQERLRSRYTPPTRAECEREAALWRRLEAE